RKTAREPPRPASAERSRFEVGQPALVDYLAVERNGLGRYYEQRLDDLGNFVGPITAIAAVDSDAIAVPPADEPEPIVLDFISPMRTLRRGPGERGKTGRYKAGRVERLEHFATA